MATQGTTRNPPSLKRLLQRPQNPPLPLLLRHPPSTLPAPPSSPGPNPVPNRAQTEPDSRASILAPTTPRHECTAARRVSNNSGAQRIGQQG